MTNVFEDGKYCNETCCIHTEQKLKLYLKTVTNWYALCPVCNPIFEDDEMCMYDCFCSSCNEFIFAIDEPTSCFMCSRLACGSCEYADDDYPEPVCGVCRKRIDSPSFREEYCSKLQDLRREHEKRKRDRRQKKKNKK